MSDTPPILLPLELIHHIISSLISNPRAILPASHPTTSTLLALTRVSRATHPVASNLLRRHCVYIDNDRRLRALIRCLEATTASAPALQPIATLYLAPYAAGTIDDQPTAIWIRELFCLARASLRRLVIDMPLRSLEPADDHLDCRRTLRDAFALLAGLEEFVSVRDQLFLSVLEPEWRAERERNVWTLWPELKRLALYNVDADESFWRDVRGMGRLDTVVLTRADGLESDCLKTAYLGSGPHSAGDDEGFREVGSSEQRRPLKAVLVNVPDQQPRHIAGRWNWDRVDPNNIMRVMMYDVPTSFYGDESPPNLSQEWVKSAALRGEVWDWEGLLVRAEKRDDVSGAQVFELEA